jgi:hypothetical protein
VLSPNLSKKITEKDVPDALADVMSRVLETGQSVIYPEVLRKVESSAPE